MRVTLNSLATDKPVVLGSQIEFSQLLCNRTIVRRTKRLVS